LRVVVPIMVLLAPGFREGVRVARWESVRWIAPEGLGWFVRYVPIDARLATAAEVIVAASALMAAVGIYARPALLVLTVATFYLFSIAQLAGTVWHDMHLIWFCALLAASPCDDVLAVDAKHSLFTEGPAYALPLSVARVLLSAIYFFPGVHKLARSGLGWALSDNLRNQMYWKWAQHGALPTLRLERPAWLLPLIGMLVLGFELGFPVLALRRRTRPLAAAAGLAFHVTTELLLLIPFASLWACYVVLVDLRPLARHVRPSLALATTPAPVSRSGGPRSSFASAIVQVVLVAGAVIQGARGQMRSYPFACYPTFEWRAGTEMPDLLVAVEQADGSEIELSSGERGRTQREWAEVWSLAGVTASPMPARLRAYYDALLQRDPAAKKAVLGASSVRFYRVLRSVIPEDQGHVVRRTLIAEITP
jgi:hypothetical protein